MRLSPSGTRYIRAHPASIEDRIKALEEANEALLKDINDLSEDTRSNFDDIYITLSEMSERGKSEDRPRNPIGFIMPKD